ncbi:MAG: PAS domain-containing protein [Alphaproteobacteria bacterium]|nr:PAS domain-containing protein [Alphaproteobacteria bacterium]
MKTKTFEHFFRFLPDPALLLNADGRVVDGNHAFLEQFSLSRAQLVRLDLSTLCNAHSDILRAFQRAVTDNSFVRIRDTEVLRHGTTHAFDELSFTSIHDGGIAVIALFRMMRSENDWGGSSPGSYHPSRHALAAVLSHEVKNPLAGIRGAAQLLTANAQDGDEELHELIISECDRITRLLDRLNMLTLDEKPQLAAVNIHEVLDHVLHIYEASDWPQMHYVRAYDPSLPPVLGHHDSLVQVFLNLVKNAGEAMGAGGKIRIHTQYRTGLRVRRGHDLTPNLPIEIRIIDNGPGVEETIVDDLFEPFVGRHQGGTGLGLSIVAKLIYQHAGLVDYKRVGEETVFTVRLQRSK